MTVRPDSGSEYDDEELRRFEEHDFPGPTEAEQEREFREREREDEEVEFVDAESNEAHAAGQACERCGQVITAVEDARRRLDGRWVHDECPVLTREPAATSPGTPS